LIVKESETFKIPKCTSFWHEMLKISSLQGGAHDAPETPSLEGLLAFDNPSFAPSALARSFRYPTF